MRRAEAIREPSSTFAFRTGDAYAYDPDARVFVVSREDEEAFLDVAQAVELISERYVKEEGVRRLTFEWSAVASLATRRSFASMLHKALDAWDGGAGQEERVVEITVLDMPAVAARFWEEDVFAVGKSRTFSRRYSRSVNSAAASSSDAPYGATAVREAVASFVSEHLTPSSLPRLRTEFVTAEDHELLVLRLPVTRHAKARESRRSRNGTATPVSSAPVCVVSDDATTTGAAVVMGTLHNLALTDAQTHCEVVGVLPMWSAKDSSSYSSAADRKEARMRRLSGVLKWTCARFRPKRVLDFASGLDERTTTSTASTVRGLFDSSFSYYCACEDLAHDVEGSCERAGERCLRMPRWKGYARYTRASATSSFVSSFLGGEMGGYAAAMFLSNFVCPRLVRRGWVHLDVEASLCLDTAVELARKCVHAPPPGW